MAQPPALPGRGLRGRPSCYVPRRAPRLAQAAACVAFVVLAGGSGLRAELMTYHVGNSLTAQLLGPNWDSRFQALTQVEGSDAIRIGNDIRPNQNLTSFVAQPDPGGSTAGHYPEAFASSTLDALFLEPWYNATVRQEAAAASELVRQLRLNPANSHTRVLVYSTWGAHSQAVPFRESWSRTDVDLDSPFFPNALAVDLFMQELRRTVPETELIPAGRVFYEIADRLQKGETVPGIPSFDDLYADSVHPTNAGAYVACLSVYAALYGKSPVGLGYPEQMLDSSWGYVLPGEGREPLQTLVNEVVLLPEPTPGPTCCALAAAAGAVMLVRTRVRRPRGSQGPFWIFRESAAIDRRSRVPSWHVPPVL